MTVKKILSLIVFAVLFLMPLAQAESADTVVYGRIYTSNEA